jgi:periplasmic protein CpxP/Spy
MKMGTGGVRLQIPDFHQTLQTITAAQWRLYTRAGHLLSTCFLPTTQGCRRVLPTLSFLQCFPKGSFMTFALKPLASLNSLLLAGLLATASFGAMAQGAATTPSAPAAMGAPGEMHPGHMMGMGRHDPAKMQAMMAKHQTELKAKLKLTPAQEGAWTTFTAAMQPPAHMGRPTPEQRAEMDKLSTPERIDKMRALRTQRMADMSAAMDKRGEATKTFYAALSPEQQKTFDAEHKKMRNEMREGRGHGPRGAGMQPKG